MSSLVPVEKGLHGLPCQGGAWGAPPNPYLGRLSFGALTGEEGMVSMEEALDGRLQEEWSRCRCVTHPASWTSIDILLTSLVRSGSPLGAGATSQWRRRGKARRRRRAEIDTLLAYHCHVSTITMIVTIGSALRVVSPRSIDAGLRMSVLVEALGGSRAGRDPNRTAGTRSHDGLSHLDGMDGETRCRSCTPRSPLVVLADSRAASREPRVGLHAYTCSSTLAASPEPREQQRAR